MSYIILKFDDLSEETLESFKVAQKICDNYGAVSCFGLVGSSLLNPSEKYVSELRAIDKSGVEIWNHGYHHTDEEFSKEGYEEQKTSIVATQQLMKKHLGKTATTFGSPHNNSTELTIQVLAENAPEINNYLFMADGAGRTNARQLVMRCNYEIKTGLIDLDYFRKEYNRIKKYPFFVMQGHPSFWGEGDFERFDEMLNILVKDGNSFITVEELGKISFPEYMDHTLEVEIDSLERFWESHSQIYFYGAGEIGREVLRYMSIREKKPSGFVVSDGRRTFNDVCGIPVYELKEIVNNKDVGIIPTIIGKTHKEVFSDKALDDIDVWGASQPEFYDQIIDYIRYDLSR